MAELLCVAGLSAGYGEAVVLEDVEFGLEEGDSLALLGRNGMGKSTLLATLMGATRQRAGSIRFGGATWPPFPRMGAPPWGWDGCRRSETSLPP